jgi:hypothetical protein
MPMSELPKLIQATDSWLVHVSAWESDHTQRAQEDTMSNKPWRCRFGMHKYVFVWTDDNQRYRRCRRCGQDHAGPTSGPMDRFTDIGGG